MPKISKASLLSTLCLTGSLLAATTCDPSPRPERLTLRHIEAKGVGYDQGYTTLEGFFTSQRHMDTEWFPFLDLRAHFFNDGRPAANGGLGLRYLTSSHVWGVNTYFDYRNTHHRDFNQWGLGFECLGRVFDFRLNGYLPVGKTESHYYHTRFDHFKGHSMILSRRKDIAFKGINGEVGAHTTLARHIYMYSAIGPYFLSHGSHQAWGGEFRVAFDLTRYFRIEGNTSYDNIFKWIGQGQVSLNYYFGGKQKIHPREGNTCAKERMLRYRALQRVDRNEIIVTEKKRVQSKAIDPATGLPYFFVFVNNTSSSSGTIESPYPTLTQAQDNSSPGNIIMVASGNGSPYLDQPITLKDNQKLFGTGIPHNLQTTAGTVKIPALSPTFPQIQTTVANAAVTLGNNNEVAGLNFSSFAAAPAVVGGDQSTMTVGITNGYIHNNQFSNSPSQAIIFINCLGNLQIENNQITNVNTGIGILNGTVPVTSNVTIVNNNVSNVMNAGIGFQLGAPSGHTDLFLANNTVTDSAGQGIVIAGGPGGNQSLCATVQDNVCTGVLGGIALLTVSNGTNGTFKVDYQRNTTTNSQIGFGVITTSGAMCVSLENNYSRSNGGNPGFGFQNMAGVLNVEDLANISSTNNGTSGSTGVVNSVPVGTCDCE